MVITATDIELVDRAAAGDEGAFEEIVDRYWKLVQWKIRRLGIPADDRADVVQEVFIKLWRDMSRVSEVLHSWDVPRLKVLVLRRSVDVVIDYRNRRGNVPPWLPDKQRHQLPGHFDRGCGKAISLEAFECVFSDGSDHVAVAEICDEAEAALSHLDETNRAIVIGRTAGYTFEELGKQHCCHRNVARLRFDRAIKRVQRHVGADGAPGPDCTRQEDPEPPSCRLVIHAIMYFGIILR